MMKEKGANYVEYMYLIMGDIGAMITCLNDGVEFEQLEIVRVTLQLMSDVLYFSPCVDGKVV